MKSSEIHIYHTSTFTILLHIYPTVPKKHAPEVYTYNMLLNALANGGLADSAEFWVDHMQRAARWIIGRDVPPPQR